jgi:hypothetical protein
MANPDTLAALTITGISTTDTPSYGRPDDWSLAGIAVTYRDAPDARTDRVVHIRDGPRPEAELDVIRDTLHWLRDRQPDLFLTYNGEYHDIPVLQERCDKVASEIPRRDPVTPRVLDDFLDNVQHRDLYQSANCDPSGYVPLADALRKHGITPPANPVVDEREITEQEIPDLAYRVVYEDASWDETEALYAYLSNAVAPLVSLHASVKTASRL